MKYLLIILLALSLGACASEAVFNPPALPTTHLKKHAPVSIYGTGSCFNTLMTKMYMRDHKIPYHYYSVTSSDKGMAYYSKIGAPGVPVITIGHKQIIGYNTDQIKQALLEAGYTV